MAKNTYTGTVDTAEIYELMGMHAKVSNEANEMAFERMFEVDEQDTEALLDATRRELALVTQANSLAFQIANSFMNEKFVAGFQEYHALNTRPQS